MSNRFFTPFSFEEAEAEILDDLSINVQQEVEVEPALDKDKINQLLNLVDLEVARIRQGISKLLPGKAITDKTIPCINFIRILREDPTAEHLETFLGLAAQDFTQVVADEWRRLLEGEFYAKD